jgi:hypothetical protein
MRLWIETHFGSSSYGILRCSGPKGTHLVFPIAYESNLTDEAGIWRLPGGTPVATFENSHIGPYGCRAKQLTVFLKKMPPATFYEKKPSLGFEIRGIRQENHPIQLYEAYPAGAWIPGRGVFTTDCPNVLNRRFLLKFAAKHAPSSKIEHVVIAIDFKGTMNEGPDQDSQRVKPFSIRTGVVRADEIKKGEASGYRSFTETMLRESTWFSRSAESIPVRNEAEIRGYILSVDVKEGDPLGHQHRCG